MCLFGGTFDPVHLGHVHAARTVAEALDVAVHMLLSARPGHRGTPGATVAQRWEMLRLACAGEARLLPDDTEIRRAERVGRPSYTVETLEELRAARPEGTLVWVIGSDAYRELATWHRWRDVFELAHLLVVRRPGAPLALEGELEGITRERLVDGPLRGAGGGIRVLDTPMQDISATAIRAALAAGGTRAAGTAHLLPRAVYTYINQYHLYGVVSDP